MTRSWRQASGGDGRTPKLGRWSSPLLLNPDQEPDFLAQSGREPPDTRPEDRSVAPLQKSIRQERDDRTYCGSNNDVPRRKGPVSRSTAERNWHPSDWPARSWRATSGSPRCDVDGSPPEPSLVAASAPAPPAPPPAATLSCPTSAPAFFLEQLLHQSHKQVGQHHLAGFNPETRS